MRRSKTVSSISAFVQDTLTLKWSAFSLPQSVWFPRHKWNCSHEYYKLIKGNQERLGRLSFVLLVMLAEGISCESYFCVQLSEVIWRHNANDLSYTYREDTPLLPTLQCTPCDLFPYGRCSVLDSCLVVCRISCISGQTNICSTTFFH